MMKCLFLKIAKSCFALKTKCGFGNSSELPRNAYNDKIRDFPLLIPLNIETLQGKVVIFMEPCV
jgi:hypothetical protein